MMLLRKLNMVFVFVIGINAMFAGYLFMHDPSGKLLGTNTFILTYSPFTDFFIPGLILFCINGLLALFTGFMLARHWKSGPAYLALQGLLLCGWIGIQMLMLRECNLLQLSFACLGIFFLCSGVYLFRMSERISE